MVSLGLLKSGKMKARIEKAESNKNNQEFDEIIRGIETKILSFNVPISFPGATCHSLGFCPKR